jgi:hypothetical protein
MLATLTPPSPDEYAPYYSDYIERVAAADIHDLLSRQIEVLHSLLDPLSDAQACFRFGPDEWSVKEMMGHVVDVERVFSYRLLRISRKDATPLPGFEQNDYVRESNFDARSMQDVLNEFEFLRQADLIAVNNLTDAMVDLRGTASGFTISVRGLIYMLAGHVEHHIASLHQNYLPHLK